MQLSLTESMGCPGNDCHTLDTYQGKEVRWCVGCGDRMILETIQKYCHDEQLIPEKTVFVAGIGCAARFPHYMGYLRFPWPPWPCLAGRLGYQDAPPRPPCVRQYRRW